MTRPVLYDYWRSSASYRVRIALNLCNIPFDTVPVDLLAGEHGKAQHLKVNPQGFVPALAIDGMMLTQSLAIIEYLDETRHGLLLPEAPEDRALVRRLSHAIAMDIHPICNPSVVNHVLSLTGGGDDQRKTWMKTFIGDRLGAVEVLLSQAPGRSYCHGARPTMADCCLVPQVYNARRWEIDLSELNRISSIAAHCEDLQAFKDAHPDRYRPT